MEQLSFLFGETLVLSNLSKATCLEMESCIANNEAKLAAIDAYVLREGCDDEERQKLMCALEAGAGRMDAAFEKVKQAFIKLVDKVREFVMGLVAKIKKSNKPSNETKVKVAPVFATACDAIKHVIRDIKQIGVLLKAKDFAGISQYIKEDAPWMKWYFAIIAINTISHGAKAAVDTAKLDARFHDSEKLMDMGDFEDSMSDGQQLLDEMKRIKLILATMMIPAVLLDAPIDIIRGRGVKATIQKNSLRPRTILNTMINILTTLISAVRSILALIASIIMNPFGIIAGVTGGAIGKAMALDGDAAGRAKNIEMRQDRYKQYLDGRIDGSVEKPDRPSGSEEDEIELRNMYRREIDRLLDAYASSPDMKKEEFKQKHSDIGRKYYDLGLRNFSKS